MNYKKDALYLVAVSFSNSWHFEEAYLKVSSDGAPTFYSKNDMQKIEISEFCQPMIRKYRKLQDSF